MQDNLIGILIISAIVAVVLFIIMREVSCWYFKINKRVEQNDEVIRLLKVIAGEKPDEKESDGVKTTNTTPFISR
jgi:hypothetical protein